MRFLSVVLILVLAATGCQKKNQAQQVPFDSTTQTQPTQKYDCKDGKCKL